MDQRAIQFLNKLSSCLASVTDVHFAGSRQRQVISGQTDFSAAGADPMPVVGVTDAGQVRAGADSTKIGKKLNERFWVKMYTSRVTLTLKLASV